MVITHTGQQLLIPKIMNMKFSITTPSHGRTASRALSCSRFNKNQREMKKIIRTWREWRYSRVCRKVEKMTAKINSISDEAYALDSGRMNWYMYQKQLRWVVAREGPLLLKSKLEWLLKIPRD